MAGSLRDALVATGLASIDQAKSIEALKRYEEEQEQSSSRQQISAGQRVDIIDLEETITVREFRDKARKLLTESPELIRDVLRVAHQFKGADGGKKLIWQLFQVRDTIFSIGPEQRAQFIQRALRAHNGTFEISPESAKKD